MQEIYIKRSCFDSRAIIFVSLHLLLFMHPRQDITAIFSTFLQLAEDNAGRWLVDPKLRRSMERHSQNISEVQETENFWVLYWYKVWKMQSNSLAESHLSAYLQEVCYWCANKTAVRFANTNYKLSDCFQMAIASVSRVLNGYNPDLNSRLKDYASAVFHSAIRDTLRRYREVNICTDWALLRRLSHKRLTESLKNAGLTSETIDRYQLAWHCFKILYVPTQAARTRQLSRPDLAVWEAIAQQYNRERYQHLGASAPSGNPEQLEQWLKECAKAARSYLYPSVASLNVPTESAAGELQDRLSATADESLLVQLIVEEEVQARKSQQAEIDEVLNGAIAQLDPETQTLLNLYYGEGLTQQKIAAQFEMKQYKVSRRLNRARESLLKSLAQWSQQTLKIPLNSTAIQGIGQILEEWLQHHYQQLETMQFQDG